VLYNGNTQLGVLLIPMVQTDVLYSYLVKASINVTSSTTALVKATLFVGDEGSDSNFTDGAPTTITYRLNIIGIDYSALTIATIYIQPVSDNSNDGFGDELVIEVKKLIP